MALFYPNNKPSGVAIVTTIFLILEEPKYFWRAHSKRPSWHLNVCLLDANPWETCLSPPCDLCIGRKGREGEQCGQPRRRETWLWCVTDVPTMSKIVVTITRCQILWEPTMDWQRLFFLLTGAIPICLGCSHPISATLIPLFQDLAHVRKPFPTPRFTSNISCGFCWAEQEKTTFPTTVDIFGGIRMAYSYHLLHVIALPPIEAGPPRPVYLHNPAPHA